MIWVGVVPVRLLTRTRSAGKCLSLGIAVALGPTGSLSTDEGGQQPLDYT